MAQIWLTFMAHLFILAHLAHFEPDLKQTDKPINKATDRPTYIPTNKTYSSLMTPFCLFKLAPIVFKLATIVFQLAPFVFYLDFFVFQLAPFVFYIILLFSIVLLFYCSIVFQLAPNLQ